MFYNFKVKNIKVKMLGKVVSGIIVLLVFLILIYLLVGSCDNSSNIETWVNYKSFPYGNIDTAAGNCGIRPAVFYDVPRFRKPLNWPVCHLVEYPEPHCRHDP